MRLGGMTWQEVPERPLVLVPVGSTEQHGPHLPLDTDGVIAAAVAHAAARALGGAVVVAPTVAYGASGEHADFPGTVSIGHDALGLQLVELMRSFAAWAGRVVVVNGHGGNVQTLATVVPLLVGERHRVSWLPCAVNGGDAHAGRTETSLMLHLAPSTVRLELSSPGNATAIAALLPELTRSGVRAVSPNGVLGDPTGASAREGALLFEAVVDGVIRRLGAEQGNERGMLRDAAVTS
jgi:mycofactocin system creatininase family protein